MIKVVVFDFDGTLVGSMKMIFEALNAALSKRGLPAIELDLLGARASKDECLYVGDSPIDVLTGKAAGIRTVAIPTGATKMEQLRENKPDITITDMNQLLKYID